MVISIENKLEDIIKVPHLFEIILNEDINQTIFEEFDINQTKRTLGNYRHQLVTVISVRKEMDGYYGLFKHHGDIVGWTRISESIYVYPKKLESVKVNLETFKTHPFNREIGINRDMVLALKDRLLTSKSFVEVGGEKLEMLFRKGKLQGYVRTSDLYKGVEMDEPYYVDPDSNRYRDSNFDIELPIREEGFTAHIRMYFPDMDIVKLQQGNRSFWMSAHEVDYDFDSETLQAPAVTEDAKQYFMEERARVKSIMDALLRRQIQLENDSERYKNRLERIEIRYKNLKESKLGKLQVGIWERMKRRRK
ncbi:hypothetical protein FO441_00885 [Salinicoccus cyprini]|uniref:Uncharacterized protein n=1 Tax=Salinicoccus cyprini TaxID=2493691 RepID=A0A558AX87_9STAP|nr:hypothetical protein [Salinicoccus cyprini]TVT28867.1 hypothetical protein FO441_00885 [Salinicoccus cyprini]